MISLVVTLAIIGALVYAAVSGYHRGWWLVGLEIVGFVIATLGAAALYQWLGRTFSGLIHISLALGNVAAFALGWIVVEIFWALAVRRLLLVHLPHRLRPGRAGRVGGGALNIIKVTMLVAVALVLWSALPISPIVKDPVLNAAASEAILHSTGLLQNHLARSIGNDLGQSLSFYTVNAEADSEQAVKLGFTTTGSVDEADEAAMLDMLNHERTSRGLKALILNTKAREVARSYSTEMLAKGYFSHVDQEGRTPFDRMKAGGVEFGSAGENLALAPTLAQAHQGLMNSSGHRANILSPHYRTVGIGIINAGRYGLMITQDFTD